VTGWASLFFWKLWPTRNRILQQRLGDRSRGKHGAG
jgi:hypothetical protein